MTGTTKRTVNRSDFGQIQVNSRGGNDTVRIDYGAEVQPFTIIDTGDGNDTVFGGSGNELFRTGAGNDVVDGNRGTDTALLGNGNDTFIWDPGDGSDVIEGGRGQDTMVFNGAAGAEKFVASANGPRLRFTRDVGNIVMDTDDVERVVAQRARWRRHGHRRRSARYRCPEGRRRPRRTAQRERRRRGGRRGDRHGHRRPGPHPGLRFRRGRAGRRDCGPTYG